MKRIYELVGSLRKAWKVPRYKGLMKIVFWIIFFGIIILVIRFGGHKPYVDNDSNVSDTGVTETVGFNSLSSYEYHCQVSDGVNTYDINGKFLNDIESFTFNSINYYLKEGKYYLQENNTETSFNIAMNEFQYNNIVKLINDKEYESKTEYKDGSLEKTYLIDAVTYNSFYQKTYQTLGNVSIKVKEMNGLIVSLDMDYSSYLNEYNTYRVVITYNNYNNVKNN